MAYCTEAQVRDIISGVTVAKMGNTEVKNKIARADSIIDAYLASKFTVPFSSTPPLIESISIDLSAYYVLRTLFTRDSVNKNNYINDFLLKHLNTKEKTGTLYDILNDDITLVDSSGTVIDTTSDLIDSNIKDYVPIFNVDDAEDWEVDPDRLEDIADERSS